MEDIDKKLQEISIDEPSSNTDVKKQSDDKDKDKKKRRELQFEDSTLEEANELKIPGIENFKKVTEEMINTRIEVNKDYGTTLVDVSKIIYDKLEDKRGKKLNEQQSLYVLNKLREKYPNRLFKRDKVYSLYDITTNKHNTATSVFGGLMLKDRPRLLARVYKT